MKPNITIDLNEFKAKGSKVLLGRDSGDRARRHSKIDELETEYEIIQIIIPDDTYSISCSFLEELLVNVVEKIDNLGTIYHRFPLIFESENASISAPHFYATYREAVENILKHKGVN